jgi:phenylalanyl-tRNA synthetase beta chain
MRPINNIVDITNYVMLEYGQPLHAFDHKQIRGRRIIVRRATDGETIVTLDGVERALSRDMLVIADAEGAVAIAGVMGGANSEVTQATTSILLEAANFNPASIHYTGRLLALPSEACMRFERGIRPELALLGLRRATQLIIQLAGGEAAKGVVDVYPGRQETEPIRLSTGEVKRLLGVEFSLDQIISTLTSLGFDCKTGGLASEVLVTAPYWRSDIRFTVDLVEEVARIMGYDKIPVTMLSQPIPRQDPAPMLSLKERVRHSLTGFGFQEIITYSLVSLESLKKLLPEPHPFEPMPLRVANPMSADQEYLRPNLQANLLTAVSTNRRYEEGGIRLFELGKVYLSRLNDLPEESEVLCGVISGPRLEKSWHGGDELVNFYDAKGVVEGLFNQLGIEANFETSAGESLHPAKQAAVVVAGNRLGVVGEIHPKIREAFDISESVYMFEINLSTLLPFTIVHRMFQPLPRFPAVTRDIALVVDATVAHKQVQDIIKGFSLVSQVTIFDVYAGAQVPPGKKSLAYRITFQSPTHTLTDEEVDQVQRQILDRLNQKLSATLRS